MNEKQLRNSAITVMRIVLTIMLGTIACVWLGWLHYMFIAAAIFVSLFIMHATYSEACDEW